MRSLLSALAVALAVVATATASSPAVARTGADTGTIVYVTTGVSHWWSGDLFVVDGSARRRNLTRSPDEFERDPDWSPDAKELVFARRRAENTDLYVRAASGAETRITATPEDETLPVWSPDGKYIAFAREADGRERLWVMRRDGSGQRALSAPSTELLAPSWSPDGARIAFLAAREVHVVEAIDVGERQLTHLGANVLEVAWRADGRIAFVREAGGGWRVVSVDPGTGDLRDERNPCGAEYSDFPSWSSDGRHVFCGLLGGRGRIVTAEGREVRRLVLAPRNEGIWFSGFSLARGGGRFAFAGWVETKDFDLAEARADTGGTRILRLEPPEDISPAVSRSGRRIAFVRVAYQGRNPTYGLGQLMVYDRATRRVRRIASAATDPSWSPDGRRIVFARNGDLFVVDVATRATRRLTRGKRRDADPAWSPDGRHIAYVRDERAASLVVLDLRTGRTRTVESRRLELSDPAWSPDGKWIAWADVADLNVVAADGTGSRRRFVDDDNPISSPSWSPDGRRIVFAKGWQTDIPYPWHAPTAHHLALFVIEAAGGSPPTRLTRGLAWEADPSWGP